MKWYEVGDELSRNLMNDEWHVGAPFLPPNPLYLFMKLKCDRVCELLSCKAQT